MPINITPLKLMWPYFLMVKKVDLKTARSAVFYNILVQKIKTRHYREKRWSTKFETNYLKYNWINIPVYHRKIKNIHCDKIAELNTNYSKTLLLQDTL